MHVPDLAGLTIYRALDGLQKGEFTSRELTQAYLERIERLDPQVHAFLHVASEEALRQAAAADERRAQGGKLPALLGIPLAVKDVLAVAGYPATCGSRILDGFMPPYTATAVSRLQQAGVVILGKTNTDEFAMGSSTENSAFGVTHNPWDLQRVPGGSSGGSAAAVASGFAPAALGTDTGGSIRQPASFCGMTGFKPTYGRISRYGLIAYGSSLDTIGALAHDARDLALLYELMAGFDPLDATSLETPVERSQLDSQEGLKGLRIGVPEEYFIAGLHPAVEHAVREAVAEMEKLGAQVAQVSLPHTEYAVPVYYLIAPAEASANLARFDGVRYGLRVDSDDMVEMFKETRGAGFGSEVKRRSMLGTYALSAGYYDAYYGQAQKVRTLIKSDFERAFEQVDVIAAPVAPTTAFPIGEHSGDPLAMYLEDVFTLPANLAGVPGIAFPVGFDSRGLPVGMQLMGAHFDEARLFRAAHIYQSATDWHTRRPALEN